MEWRRTSRAVCTAVWVALTASAFVGGTAEGQDDVEGMREQLRAMMAEAEALFDRGSEEAGRVRLEELAVLGQELRELERRRKRPEVEHLHEVLRGLEHGMAALRELDRGDALHMMEEIADDVRREIERRARGERGERGDRGADRKREIAHRQMEVLHMLLPAFRETGREEAVKMAERAIRAKEIALEGRRDEESRAIRQRAPGREETRELLALAEKIYREHDAHDRADVIGRAMEELWARPARARGPREGGAERESAERRLEVMRLAMPALLEAGRRDTAELLEHAIHALELRLEGRRDVEAREIMEGAPSLAQQVEILAHAAKKWREFGDEDKAERLDDLAREMWAGREPDRREHADPDRPQRNRDEGVEGRIEHLERQLDELRHALEAVTEQLAELRHAIR